MAMAMGMLTKKVVATKIVGADGTGDFLDIQTAIDALPAGGGVVYVKEGTYEIDEAITIQKSNVALMGAGAATNIKLATDSDSHCVVLGDNSTIRNGIVISDILVDGNKANNAGAINGIYLAGKIEDSKITGCWVKDCDQHGIATHQDCERNIITENTCAGNDDFGIYVIDSDEPNIISNNSCSSNLHSGIYVGSTTGPTYTIGNVCSQNSYYGIYAGTKDSVINSNMCVANTLSGIYNRYGLRNNLIGNTCKQNGQHGILLDIAASNTVTGNTCTRNSQTTDNTYDGIRLTGACKYNSITANTIYKGDFGNSHKYGINEEAATADYNIILGNTMYQGADTAGIRVQGANTINEHNVVQGI